MATCPSALMTMALMMIIISSVVASPSGNEDISVAIEEMERANYFTFVMLINMVPPNLFQGNVTFLMPNDRSLSRTMIPAQNSVVDLLLHHSIPAPLLFDHLLHLPTNSILPTSNPDLMLKVSNSGRRSLFLGNVKIVSPNICTHGYSVRCHGIDGVISIEKPGLASPITCPRVASADAPLPLMAPPSSSPGPGPGPSPSPSPSGSPASDSPHGAAYETSGGVRSQRVLPSTTCIAFVWLLYNKVKLCV